MRPAPRSDDENHSSGRWSVVKFFTAETPRSQRKKRILGALCVSAVELGFCWVLATGYWQLDCGTISTMHELAKKLLSAIRKQELLCAGDRVAVAVSGGADSVALLCLLEELREELGIVLSVAHVNHKLRGAESDEDERFVSELAAARGLDFHTVDASIGKRAGGRGGARAKVGVEAAARELRYEFFCKLARQGRVVKIATAHTLDDQAETVLLRIFRGTGIRGLAGIHPRVQLLAPTEEMRSIHDAAGGAKTRKAATAHDEPRQACEVVRPLLAFRRAQLREYLQARGQSWREDSSNEDVAFLRNRVRRRLLPLIAEEFGEAAIEHIAELAEIARAENSVLSTQYPVASTQHLGLNTSYLTTPSPASAAGTAARSTPIGATLDLGQLLALPLAVARRQVRAWMEANAPEVSISFRLIEEILELARGAAGKTMELPGRALGGDAGVKEIDSKAADERNARAGNPRLRTAGPKQVRRGRRELAIESAPCGEAGDYEYSLPVPGEVAVPELGARIEARLVEVQSVPERERDGLLDPDSLGKKVVIRNWRAGDRFWPGHTSAEKKVKELLSDRHATGAKKKLWPVAVKEDGSLVWMRGFAAPAAIAARATGKAIWMRELGTSP